MNNGVSKRVCVAMLTINAITPHIKENTEWAICGIVFVCLMHYISGLFKDRKNGKEENK
ncbi:hypothetical protein LCGC14_1092960 [marine sediment metagenome]|uniref:Uncharacterized protein n=1 Tax=marine sediment metagenome TaxID=412755 RepID=A0A0F9QHT9_9ZZZZ